MIWSVAILVVGLAVLRFYLISFAVAVLGAAVLVAQSSFSLRSATATSLKVKLTRPGAALLAKNKSGLRATATANGHDRIGASKVTSRAVTIK